MIRLKKTWNAANAYRLGTIWETAHLQFDLQTCVDLHLALAIACPGCCRITTGPYAKQTKETDDVGISGGKVDAGAVRAAAW